MAASSTCGICLSHNPKYWCTDESPCAGVSSGRCARVINESYSNFEFALNHIASSCTPAKAPCKPPASQACTPAKAPCKPPASQACTPAKAPCCTPYNPCVVRPAGECSRDPSLPTLGDAPSSPGRFSIPPPYKPSFPEDKLEEQYENIVKRENYHRQHQTNTFFDILPITDLVREIREKHRRAIFDNSLFGRRLRDSQFIVPSGRARDYYNETAQNEIETVFKTISDLPPCLSSRLVIAGGAVTDFITGNRKPNDYDLFIIKSSISSKTPEDVVRGMLNAWKGRISRISRTQHAITLSLDINPREPETMTDRQRLYRIYGLCDNPSIDAFEKLNKIRELLPPKHKGHYVKIQIILREYTGIQQILLGFDIDACRFAWYGSQVYATNSAIFALENAVNVVNLSFASETYNYRLVKYLRKGFCIYVPKSLAIVTVGHYKARDHHRVSWQKTHEGTLVGLLFLAKKQHSSYRRYVAAAELYKSDYCAIDPNAGCKKTTQTIRYFYQGKKIIGYGFNPYFVDMSTIFSMPDSPQKMSFEKVEVPEKLTLITINPDRQFTGSFHPMDVVPATWGVIDIEYM